MELAWSWLAELLSLSMAPNVDLRISFLRLYGSYQFEPRRQAECMATNNFCDPQVRRHERQSWKVYWVPPSVTPSLPSVLEGLSVGLFGGVGGSRIRLRRPFRLSWRLGRGNIFRRRLFA